MIKPGWRQRGATSIELAILTPAVIGFFVAVVIAGRVTLARQAADSAAYDAARTASLARTAATAQPSATNAALASFNSQGITCTSLSVFVNIAGFSIPVGQSATVTVTVTCVVMLSDIALPGMPGSTTLTSSFVSPLDRYRERG